jgi:hypothetical protein
MKKDITFFWFILVLIIYLAGCPVTQDLGNPDSGIEDTTIEEVSDLFQEDPPDSGIFVFQTNSSSYWGPYGYTLWSRDGGESQNPLSQYEVTVSKISGNDTAGYGIVFCNYVSADPDVGQTMLTVMINNSKEYIIGEVIGANFEVIEPWTFTECLLEGYNQTNTIKVSYNNGSGIMTLYLNGTEVSTFRDEEAPFHTGGHNGFIVVISPLDNFPANPVHIIFNRS